VSRDYPDRPWVGVGVVVCRADRVLLIQRGKPPRQGQWSLPGGVQELGETVAAAALREVREETGLDIALGPLIDVIDSVERDGDGRVRRHYTLIDFAARWRGGDPVAGDDALDARWFDAAALAGAELWPETRRVIARAQQLLTAVS
jgi:ADP-ribose pyrophosphatase YjhB (NUDIX family)